MAYLIDADVFIRAKNEHYGFELCPGFWDWLERMHASDVAHSVDAVYTELTAGDDDLARWAADHRSFFLPLTAAELAAVAALNRWANDSTHYEPSAKAEFARSADSFLIGHALAGGHVVVTHETVNDSRRRIKIPNAAAAHNVRVVNPFQMLKAEGAQFVLGSQSRQLRFSDLGAGS